MIFLFVVVSFIVSRRFRDQNALNSLPLVMVPSVPVDRDNFSCMVFYQLDCRLRLDACPWEQRSHLLRYYDKEQIFIYIVYGTVLCFSGNTTIFDGGSMPSSPVCPSVEQSIYQY